MPKIKRFVSASELICEGLLSLVETGQKPYSEITIQDIVNEAGVCRNSFYRNFRNKKEIFQKKFLEICEEEDSFADGGVHFDYFDILRAVCLKFQKHRRFFRCFYKADLRSYFDTITSHVIFSNAPENTETLSSTEYYTYACRAWLGIGVVTEWFNRDCDISIDELVDIVGGNDRSFLTK